MAIDFTPLLDVVLLDVVLLDVVLLDVVLLDVAARQGTGSSQPALGDLTL